MSYQVLSRKWRPKKFQEVIGQVHVTKSLQNSILKNRLGHAYIFTGTRGIGKTSVARIFAKSLRCLERLEDANPCKNCRSCLEFDGLASMNITEMDGASNNSVDDIRDLVSNVQTLPTFGIYKIYIIDEVHMLSVSAFNALLKTLEEPPEHAIFLLATTEPHKVPDTVLSRCQRFDFKNASTETLTSHLVDICEKEGVSFDNPNLPALIATEAKGSFRDTLSLMDQVLSFCDGLHVSEETLSIALGMAKVSSIKKLCLYLLFEEPENLSKLYKEQLFSNVSLENIARSVLNVLYQMIQNIDQLDKVGYSPTDLNKLSNVGMDELFWIFESLSQDTVWALSSLTPDKSLEMVLQKHAMRSEFLVRDGPKAIPTKKKDQIVDSLEPIAKNSVINQKLDHEVPTPTVDNTDSNEASPENGLDRTWSGFENYLKKELPAISAQLLHGNIVGVPELDEERVNILYGFSEKSKVFYDHLIQEGTKEKLEKHMMQYFKTSKVNINFEYVEKNIDFKSKAEIIEKNDEDIKNEKLNNFKNHPIIKEAEQIFGSTLDKVRIKE